MTQKLEQASEVTANENLPFNTVRALKDICDSLVTVPDDIRPGAKCFYSPDGSVFIGIPLVETSDSFLVAASARLSITKDRSISADPITSEPVMRLFKNSLKYMVDLSELSTYHYYVFLKRVGYGEIPDYFTKERKDYIDRFLEDNSRGELPSLTNSNADEVDSDASDKLEGETDYSFTPFQKSESVH